MKFDVHKQVVTDVVSSVQLIDGTSFEAHVRTYYDTSEIPDPSEKELYTEIHQTVRTICIYQIDGVFEFDFMRQNERGMLDRIQTVKVPIVDGEQFMKYQEIANANQIDGHNKDTLLDMLIVQ